MTMEFSREKVAIITGSSRGIGAGLVEAYRKHGCRVIANFRTIAESSHPEVVTVAGDIGDPSTAQRIVAEAVARFGRIDTPLHAGVDAATAYAGMYPQNRIGAVADIVHGALYLETSPFVTGEILHVDGGQTAGH